MISSILHYRIKDHIIDSTLGNGIKKYVTKAEYTDNKVKYFNAIIIWNHLEYVLIHFELRLFD